jgi:hypothetical protein
MINQKYFPNSIRNAVLCSLLLSTASVDAAALRRIFPAGIGGSLQKYLYSSTHHLGKKHPIYDLEDPTDGPICKSLIVHPYAVEIKKQEMLRAWHIAIDKGGFKEVFKLLKKNNNGGQNIANEYGFTALHRAVSTLHYWLENDTRIIQALVEDPSTDIFARTNKGHSALDIVRLLGWEDAEKILLGALDGRNRETDLICC